MDMVSNALPGIIAALYEAALEPDRWQLAWRSATRYFGGSSSSLFIQDRSGGPPDLIAMPGFSETALRLYGEHYHSVDLWAAMGRMAPSFSVHAGEDVVSEEEFRSSEVWNDFARVHVGAFRLIGAAIPLGGSSVGIIGIHRPENAAAFNGHDRQQLAAILPHLQRALQIRARFAAMEIRNVGQAAALSALPFGIIIATPAGEVLFANAAAETLARVDDGISFGRLRRGLATMRPDETDRLLKLVRIAANRGPGGAMCISRRAGGAPLAVVVSPLPEQAVRPVLGHERRLALIMIKDIGATAPMPESVLCQLFDLTPAEAALAKALQGGKRLKEIAASRGTQMTTLRTQLRSLLAKTETARQSDLIRLLGDLPISRHLNGR